MELQKIREFLVLAELLNFSRAAIKVGISQPALSRHMRELEEEVGSALFVREVLPLRLTEMGLQLQKDGLKLAESADALLLEMREISNEYHEALHIGFIPGAMTEDVVCAMQEMRQDHPGLKAHLYEMSPAQQMERLSERKLDIALIGARPPGVELRFDIFFVGFLSVHLILPERSPLAAQSLIHVPDLKELPLVGRDEQYFPASNEYTYRICRAAGFEPNFVAMADGGSSLMSLLAANEAYGMAPDITARMPHPGLVFRQMDSPEAYVECNAAVALGESRPTVRRYLNCIRRFQELSKLKRDADFTRLMVMKFGKLK